MKENQELEEPYGLSNESLEKALGASLTLLFVFATADLLMYHFAGTAALTVIAHILSLLLYLKHQLRLDLVKILEMVALVIDGVLIVKEGYALTCPISTLIVIIYIGLNRERHLLRMKEDLQKVFAAKQK
ncbi:MAG: hypothetical protein VXZ71_07010 [SAR324 cluster bacterium]|nr:hypothetical protein [SAR324 cluster bacterium]